MYSGRIGHAHPTDNGFHCGRAAIGSQRIGNAFGIIAIKITVAPEQSLRSVSMIGLRLSGPLLGNMYLLGQGASRIELIRCLAVLHGLMFSWVQFW